MLQANLGPRDRATLSLSYDDYLRFSKLLAERFGLSFPEKRRTELEIGVRRAFMSSICADFDKYFAMLCDPVYGALELERLANHLTVGETYFFRDAGQMDALVNTVLPEIIERRRSSRTLRIWSAGCASGEEPYSIAMLLYDLLPDLERWNITILGTDLNTQNLEKAHRARYTDWAFRETRAKLNRARFFVQQDNQFELIPEIRRLVLFRRLNLADDSYPSYETNTMFMDLILCRNVTIYFPEAVTRGVVNRFYNALVDGGWFVIGHSEHTLSTYQHFHPHSFPDAILYQRLAETPAIYDVAAKRPSASMSQPAPSLRPGSSGGLALKPILERPSLPGLPVSGLPAAGMPAAGLPAAEPPGAKKLSEVEQAQQWISEGRVDQARDLLLRWLTDHPNDSTACMLLGKTYANLGNWQESYRWCQLAINSDKLNLEAYYTLSLIYQHQGQHVEAMEMMKKVIYIDRTDILGYFSMANLFYHNGQAHQALKALENTRKLLEPRPLDALVPRSGDITVGRLAQTVLELQQIWSSEAAATR